MTGDSHDQGNFRGGYRRLHRRRPHGSPRICPAILAAEHIAVYDVRPGIIETDMTAAVHADYDGRIADGLVPERRWGSPDDVGRVVAALVRGDLPYATGSVINVDGGLSIPRL